MPVIVVDVRIHRAVRQRSKVLGHVLSYSTPWYNLKNNGNNEKDYTLKSIMVRIKI